MKRDVSSKKLVELDARMQALYEELNGIEGELEEARWERDAEWRRLNPRDPNEPLSLIEEIAQRSYKAMVEQGVMSKLVKP